MIHRPAMLLVVLLLAGLVLACDETEGAADAYGTFDADHRVRVATEVGGKLLAIDATKGARLDADVIAARVEPTALMLERAQLLAHRDAATARATAVGTRIDVLDAQLELAETELARVERLLAEEAATPRQHDRATSEVDVLRRQREQARADRTAARREVEAMTAQLARIDDRLSRTQVLNPLAGVVLERFAEAGEIVAAGQPLYEIAELDPILLRVYVSGGQLPGIRLGQAVRVVIDESADTDRLLDGEVVWIAEQAEFTPTTLQTKEERVDLVYAVEIRVPNPDGRIKIGMPGELRLPSGDASGPVASGQPDRSRADAGG